MAVLAPGRFQMENEVFAILMSLLGIILIFIEKTDSKNLTSEKYISFNQSTSPALIQAGRELCAAPLCGLGQLALFVVTLPPTCWRAIRKCRGITNRWHIRILQSIMPSFFLFVCVCLFALTMNHVLITVFQHVK
ncbi:uncharacterized protein LOC143695081 [Agelaius phoeniceus]|uniref:uncharacterized protein LOC143695081 n=1 Tax=Agelaius phoeniceus TaxID=39638 RepID=UPI00405510B8